MIIVIDDTQEVRAGKKRYSPSSPPQKRVTRDDAGVQETRPMRKQDVALSTPGMPSFQAHLLPHHAREQEQHQTHPVAGEQPSQQTWQQWMWEHVINMQWISRLTVSTCMTLVAEIGQPNLWSMFPFLLVQNTCALLFLTWLLGQVCVSALVVLHEWRLVMAHMPQVPPEQRSLGTQLVYSTAAMQAVSVRKV